MAFSGQILVRYCTLLNKIPYNAVTYSLLKQEQNSKVDSKVQFIEVSAVQYSVWH